MSSRHSSMMSLHTQDIAPSISENPVQEVMKHFRLREQAGADPQTYALGLKEVWEVRRLATASVFPNFDKISCTPQ